MAHPHPDIPKEPPRAFSLINTTWRKIWAKPLSKNENRPLPVDMRHGQKHPNFSKLVVGLNVYKSLIRIHFLGCLVLVWRFSVVHVGDVSGTNSRPM